MVNGTLMVPVRLLEVVGARVAWDGGSKTAVLQRGDASIRLTVGSPYAWVDDRRVTLPEPPVLINGRLMVPLRAAAEGLGLEVRWDARLGRADLVAPPPVQQPEAHAPAPSRSLEAPLEPVRGALPARPVAVALPPAMLREAGGTRGGSPSSAGTPPPVSSTASQATAYVPSPPPSPPPLRPSLEEQMETLLSVLPVPRAADEGHLASTGWSPPGVTAAGAPSAAGSAVGAADSSQPATSLPKEPASAPSGGPALPSQAPPAPLLTHKPLAAVGVEEATPPAMSTSRAEAQAERAPDMPAASPPSVDEPLSSESPKPASPVAAKVQSQASGGQEGSEVLRTGGSLVEVTGVSVRREAGRSRIDIISEGPVRLRGEPMVLADPPRLVLDLEGARLGAAIAEYPADTALVKSVRMAQHTADVVRIAIDLTSPVGYQLQQDAETGQLSVLLRHAVSAVYWVWGAGGRGQLWVEMSGVAAVRTATLTDPLRMVVDIQQATLVTSAGEWEVSSGPVRRFRVSQFQPDVVRIVLELAQPIQPRIVTSLDLTRSLLEADPGKAQPPPPGDMDLVLDVYSRITGVSVQPIGPQGAAVVVQATAPIEPRTFYLRNPGRLVLDLPGAVVDPGLDREQLEQTAGVGPAVSVRVGQFLPRSARVVVELRQPVGYRLFSADSRQTLVLALGDRPLTGRTVAIDAGHGGHDPGAIGASGTPEKVYNLDIAQRLATLLESVGVEVSMTRRTDVYIGLDDRVAAAVRAGADVFISVHNNASPSRQAVGTEVFYSPNGPASQRLAELLYESLLDKLDRPARGVRMRRDLRVLRLAPMPAALVEVAFVDNAEDEARLRDPSFRQQAAEAMFAAIVSFLSQVGNDTVGTARIPVAR